MAYFEGIPQPGYPPRQFIQHLPHQPRQPPQSSHFHHPHHNHHNHQPTSPPQFLALEKVLIHIVGLTKSIEELKESTRINNRIEEAPATTVNSQDAVRVLRTELGSLQQKLEEAVDQKLSRVLAITQDTNRVVKELSAAVSEVDRKLAGQRHMDEVPGQGRRARKRNRSELPSTDDQHIPPRRSSRRSTATASSRGNK